MKTIKFKHKTIVVLGSIIVVMGATAFPSSANFLAGSIPISFLPSSWTNSLTSPVTGIASQFLTVFTNLSDSLKTWGSQLTEEAMNVTYGSLGLPDLTTFELDLEQIFTNEGKYVTLDEAQHTTVSQTTRAHAAQTLSHSGQQQIQDRQSQSVNSIDSIDSQAIAAQGEFVTQNVLKRLAIQNAQQGLLLGTVGSEITNLSVKQDLANYNLANISEAIGSQNLARQSDWEGSSLSVLETSTLLRME